MIVSVVCEDVVAAAAQERGLHVLQQPKRILIKEII
jgi:hypothetical protein